ncbi:MAG: hypothetical protein U0R19_25020 [Bryobacteraceae bacterium]
MFLELADLVAEVLVVSGNDGELGGDGVADTWDLTVASEEEADEEDILGGIGALRTENLWRKL